MFSEFARDMMIRNSVYEPEPGEQFNLAVLMNQHVKPALNIPEHIEWASSSRSVFDTLRGDFMKPVTDSS